MSEKVAYTTIEFHGSWYPSDFNLPEDVDRKTFEDAVNKALNDWLNTFHEAPDNVNIDFYGF